MKSFISAALVLFLATVSALAQDGPPNEGTTAQPPQGYEMFFKEIAKVMQSYPDAAKRFVIFDTSVKREMHQCPKGQVWGCREVCSDWPHCHECTDWGCVEILK